MHGSELIVVDDISGNLLVVDVKQGTILTAKERFRLQEYIRLTKVKSDSVKQVVWSNVNPLGPCFVTNDRDSG